MPDSAVPEPDQPTNRRTARKRDRAGTPPPPPEATSRASNRRRRARPPAPAPAPAPPVADAAPAVVPAASVETSAAPSPVPAADLPAEATAPVEAVGAAGVVDSTTELPGEDTPPEPPGRGLALLIGGPEQLGRPTWLDVPPARVGTVLTLLADEGARLLAMTVLPPAEAPAAPEAAPPPEVDLRYHFMVHATPITVSTRTPTRGAPTAADLFPAMAWRERELAGEHGLRFVVVPPEEEERGTRDEE